MFTSNLVTVILALLAVGTPQDVSLGTECKINNTIDGACLVVTLCQRAIQLLLSNDIESLRNMTCGFEGVNIKVCCPIKDSTKDSIVFQNNKEVATSRPKATATKDGINSTTARPTKMTTKSVTTEPLIPLMTTDIPSISESLQEERVPSNPVSGFDEKPIATYPPDISEGTSIPPKPSFQPLNVLPNRNICGLINNADKIYGGSITELDEFPWLVRIKYKKRENNTMYACLGSLITDRYVLTAAHCIVNPYLEITDVRLGEWDEESKIDCYKGYCNEPPVDLKIDKTIVHPGYNRNNYIHDIALMRLEKPVNFTDFIQPVCLPTTDYVARQDYTPDSTYETAGWGLTEFEKASPIKRKVRLNAVPIDICRVAQPRMPVTNIPYSICAGGSQGYDTCRGDSGGSLVKIVAENYHANWFIYGITSYGAARCGAEGIPAVYTRVTSYMEWIIENVSQ